MTSKLDQSLGDIITTQRSQGGSKGGRRNRGQTASDGAAAPTNGSSNGSHPLSRDSADSTSGPVRRERSSQRKSPYPSSRPGGNGQQRWQNDLYHIPVPSSLPLPLGAAQHRIEKVVGKTLAVSNLGADVTADDVRSILSPLGRIRSCQVHYDRGGRSLGTAQVEFDRAEDADRAVAEFDRAEVDGREMRIKLVGQVVSQVVALPPPMGPQMGQQFNPMLMTALMGMGGVGGQGGQGGQRGRGEAGRGGREGGGVREKGQQQGRGEGRDGQGQGQGRRDGKGREGGRGGDQAGGAAAGGGSKGRKERAPVKAEDLDAEMESYHAARQGTGAAETAAPEAAAPAPVPAAAE